MKPQYLVIGFVIVLIPFLLLWLRVTSVQDSSNDTTQPVQTNQGGQGGYENLPDAARQADRAEKEVLLILSRGKVTSYDKSSKVLQVLAENRTGNGMETRSETIGLNNLTQVKCWPQYIPTTNGPQINLASAYIPLEPDKDLYLKNETVKSFSQGEGFLSPGTYVFVKKSKVSGNATSTAQQLAIIGC